MTERTRCRYSSPGLHAYDTVSDWGRRHGPEAGPPREIYPGTWPEDPAAHAADIALPYREDQP